MKSVIGHVIAALLLAGAGGVLWMLGGAERRVAQAHEALATMRYAAVADTAGDLEASLRFAGRVPRIGGGMTSAVHEDRSTAEYWLKRYDTLAPQHDASGAIVERDAEALFTASNAAYRIGFHPHCHDEGRKRQRSSVRINPVGLYRVAARPQPYGDCKAARA